MIESISAVTLQTADMARAVGFYQNLGFELGYGSSEAPFSNFRVGSGFLNLELAPGYRLQGIWGRVIFYVADVDALYEKAISLGLEPSTTPVDARWGERYFHISDPDGHELSFARRIS